MNIKIEMPEELTKDIERITFTKYENNLENLIEIIKDLVVYYDSLDEQFSDYKKDIEENCTVKRNDYEEEYFGK